MTDEPTPPPSVRHLPEPEYQAAKRDMLRVANQKHFSADEARRTAAAITNTQARNSKK